MYNPWYSDNGYYLDRVQRADIKAHMFLVGQGMCGQRPVHYLLGLVRYVEDGQIMIRDFMDGRLRLMTDADFEDSLFCMIPKEDEPAYRRQQGEMD